MKRLDRYLLGRFFAAWSAAMVFFSVMYLLIHFFNQIGALDRAEGGFAGMGLSLAGGLTRYYLTNLVFVMMIFVPFTVVLAAMWSGQQVARKGELIAVLAAGISLRRVALPILLAAFGIGLVAGVARETVLPDLAAARHELDRAFKGQSQAVLGRLPMIADGEGQVLHVGRYDVGARTAERVRVMDVAGSAREPLDADAISWDEEDSRWVLAEGADWSGPISRLAQLQLSPRDIEVEERKLLFSNVAEIRRLLERHPDRSSLILELHAHHAYPFGCLVLALLGLPLVLRPSRGAPFAAAGVGLLVSMAFFVTQRILADLGTRDELISPALGAWLPVLIFGALGLLAVENMRT